MNVLAVLCGCGWMPVHLSEGWRRLGWTVDEYFYGTHMGRDWTPEGTRRNHAINRDLIETAKRLKAAGRLDLMFMVIYDDVLEEDAARELRTLGVPMVNYHVDMVGQWQRVLITGRYFDRVACAQRDHWDALVRAGIRPYLMPMAANPSAADEPVQSPVGASDGVLYLGSPWRFRTQVLAAVAQAGLPLRIYGHGWQESAARQFNYQPRQKTWHDLRYYALPYLREEGLRPLVNAITRRLRDHTAGVVPQNEIPPGCIQGQYGNGDLGPFVRGAAINLGFTHFKGIPGTPGEERQLRLRDFEIPMAGGFYLAQDCAQLRELFEPGVHVAAWNGVGDLIEKVRYYLSHPDERQRVAAAGKTFCEKNHTWEVRYRGLLNELKRAGS